MDAYKVMHQIRTTLESGETPNFSSPYTTASLSQYSPMTVSEVEILLDLTQEQRLELSDKSGSLPLLKIWTTTHAYVARLDRWVEVSRFNFWNADHSWYPPVVILEDGYAIVKTDNDYKLYKVVV